MKSDMIMKTCKLLRGNLFSNQKPVTSSFLDFQSTKISLEKLW